jgi:hypothetical protein
MSVNINSMDLATLSVFKRELIHIEALNLNVSPTVIEYLTQRIADIEDPPPLKLSDSC